MDPRLTGKLSAPCLRHRHPATPPFHPPPAPLLQAEKMAAEAQTQNLELRLGEALEQLSQLQASKDESAREMQERMSALEQAFTAKLDEARSSVAVLKAAKEAAEAQLAESAAGYETKIAEMESRVGGWLAGVDGGGLVVVVVVRCLVYAGVGLLELV